MASVVEESYDSLPPAQLAALELQRQQLLQTGPKDNAHDAAGQQAPTVPVHPTAEINDDALDAHVPTVPDSLDMHRRLPRPTPSPKRPRLSSSNSAPTAEMEAMAQPVQLPRLSKGVAKAASFAGGVGHHSQVGDTQPVDSQVYHRYSMMESMREEPEGETPQKQQSAADTSPETMATDEDQTPQQTLQPGHTGYIDLAGAWREEETSPTTSVANYDELLVQDNAKSPDTQFYQPHRPTMPETPALAGQKHGRDGEPLTSATTAPKYSQFFPQGKVMGATQLFAQTQEPSSPPVEGEPSDDAMTRPSPNTNGATSSPRTMLSSPVVTKHIRTSSGVGEPRTEYKSMKESQEERERRLRAEKEGLRDELQEDSDEDTQQIRFRARQLRRSRSEQALREAAGVSAPPRGVWMPSSARKSVVDLVTPATIRRRVGFDDILEEAEDETQAELPEEPSNNHEDDEDAEASHHDDDQYDELQESLIRSQSNFQANEDDDASFVGSTQEDGVEVPNNDEALEDAQDPGNVNSDGEDDELQDPRGEVRDTQRSTIADSQPLGHAHAAPRTSSLDMHHSSMASFVPGSQYTGKTSQDQAFLKMSHPSQSRIAASQAEKVPSSPPLPRASVDTTEHSDAAHNRREMPQLRHIEQEATRDDPPTPQEVPDSDAADNVVQGPRLETRTNGLAEEESNNHVPFSTAQTHVSASMRSPSKSFAASPMKAFRSQQIETPRKAFSDMIDGPKASNDSFNFGDVDEIMAGVMTKEDEDVLAVLSTPKPKRRKTTRSSPSSTTLRSGNTTSDQHSHEQSDTSRTIQDSEPDFARPAIPAKTYPNKHAETEVLPESVTTSEMAGTIPESAHNSVQLESREPVLRDSPNKANVLPLAPVQGSEKAPSLTPDSVRQREDAGSRHAAQLISTTRSSSSASKKGKLKTFGRAARRKSNRAATNASEKTSMPRYRHADDADELGDEEVDVEGAAAERELVDDVNRNDTTPPPAERVHQDFDEHTLPMLEDLADEDHAEQAEQQDIGDTFSAPERLWALFRGTPTNYYPATWITGSPDGLSYKVRFDDETTTTIDSWLVRALDLRIGDQVKVDNGVGSRSTTWRIVGYGAVAGGRSNRELRTDTQGHTHVKVQATSNRNSKGGAVAEDADEVREVLVSDLYLTSGMWKHYKDREFSPPTAAKAMASRPGTPSSRLQTPTGDTPSSRSRRGGPVVSKSKKVVGTSHLRDASVASSTSAGATAIFSGMAFAITYISDDAEKAQVTRAILRNGGIILEDGFGELFDIPNIGETITSPSKKSPRKNTDDEPHEAGLRLKSKYDNCGFVALIADRHSRRAKYMQALALDLPTLSGRWILDSLNEEKNPALSTREIAPLPWGKYLLPAGESSYLGGAIRSRIMLPYDAASTQLRVTVNGRPQLLNDEGVLIVAPKKDKVAWERRKTYAFLTLALGAGMVERVNDLEDAKSMMEADPKIWRWIYVDGKIEEAFAKLCGKTSGGKKRKRVSDAAFDDGTKMSVTDGKVTVVNDEFVVQSLILGALAE